MHMQTEDLYRKYTNKSSKNKTKNPMGGGHKYRSSKLVTEVGSVPLSPGEGGLH